MKVFKSEEYIKMANPTPGQPYRPEILTKEHQAKSLGGMFGLLVAGSQVPYHVLFIPAGEKHTTINRSKQDFRYLEFFTHPPIGADFVEVK
jgi:hypothetical protein